MHTVYHVILHVYGSIYSKNVFMGETDNTTLPVQTPAVDFTITNDSVSNYFTSLYLMSCSD